MITDGDRTDHRISRRNPSTRESNLASMGIYIFSSAGIKGRALTALKDRVRAATSASTSCRTAATTGRRLFAYEYNGYWKDVGTLGSYWEANMELIHIIPEFNLYEEFWKIYTKGDIIPSAVSSRRTLSSTAASSARAQRSTERYIIPSSEPDVRHRRRASVVRDSIIMQPQHHRRRNAVVDKAIIAENVHRRRQHVVMGVGEDAPDTAEARTYITASDWSPWERTQSFRLA